MPKPAMIEAEAVVICADPFDGSRVTVANARQGMLVSADERAIETIEFCCDSICDRLSLAMQPGYA